MNGPDIEPELLQLLQGMRTRFATIDRQLMGLQADIAAFTAEAARPQAETPRPAPPAQATGTQPTWGAPTPMRTPEPTPTPPPQPPKAPAQQPAAQAATAPPPPPEPYQPMWLDRQFATAGNALRAWRGDLDFSDFLGLRALAWLGGIITLLGIAFFYVLANQQGWVGPGSRVLLGTSISFGLLGLAGWLRHLKGEPEAALAAAGRGSRGCT